MERRHLRLWLDNALGYLDTDLGSYDRLRCLLSRVLEVFWVLTHGENAAKSLSLLRRGLHLVLQTSHAANVELWRLILVVLIHVDGEVLMHIAVVVGGPVGVLQIIGIAVVVLALLGLNVGVLVEVLVGLASGGAEGI